MSSKKKSNSYMPKSLIQNDEKLYETKFEKIYMSKNLRIDTDQFVNEKDTNQSRLKIVLNYFYEYSLLIWDGLPFFGFDDIKLARIKGKPIRFTDKCMSIRWLIFTLVSLSAIFYIVQQEVKNLN